MDEHNKTEVFFTTELGKQVRVTPISLMMAEAAKNSVKEPGQPLQAIEIDVEGQPPVMYPMRDLADARNEQERREWLLYEQKLAKAATERGERWIKALLLGSVAEHVEIPDNDRWERIQKVVGIEIPEDPDERLLHYLTTEILTAPEDLMGLITKIVELSGVDEEVVKSIEDTFRHSLRGAKRSKTNQTLPDTER